MLKDTKVNVAVADWNELALYIALTHDQETISKIGLEDLVHQRRYKAGPRPGITTSRAYSGPPHSEIEEKWLPQLRTPTTEQEKKALIIEAVITEVEAVMKNHCYAFNDN